MKNMKKPVFPAILAIIAITAFVGCKYGTVGIFESLAGETAINNDISTGFKTATPSFMASFNGSYYAGLGKLWSRTKAAGSKWVEATPPGTGIYADSGEAAGSLLYVSFRNLEGDPIGVWSLDSTSIWARVDENFPASGSTIQRIMKANDILFTTCAKTDPITLTTAYSVYRLNGSAFDPIASLANLATRPTDMVWDGLEFLLAAETKLYGSADGVTFTDRSVPASTTLTSITYDADLKLVATSSNGMLHQSLDSGATWASSAAFTKTSVAYYLTQALIVPFGTSKRLLVGTDSKYLPALTASGGYLDFDASSAAIATWATTESAAKTPISDAINFDTSVGNNPVPKLFVFQEADGVINLFACTGGLGLWLNTYSGSAWSKWQRESDQ